MALVFTVWFLFLLSEVKVLSFAQNSLPGTLPEKEPEKQTETEALPEVVTKSGKIIGVHKKSFGGFTYKSFEGIPYALPINSENRFKPAVLYHKKYANKIWNASTQAAPCLHQNQFHKDDHGDYAIKGEEDCLYLNIYTREDGKKNKAVIINIHPGGFGQTSSEDLGPEFLMDREGIILVTFNYRLNIFGFLSTGDAVVPGNNGLKDQVVLIRWVKENIKAFGGNANKITLMGLSAGGASVHYHILSPMSKGEFQRAISFSGTALCPWALIHDVPQKTQKLAGLLGCPTRPSALLVECLRQRPAHVIVKQLKYFESWLYNPFTVFGPVIEKNTTFGFISDHPVNLMTSHSWWPWYYPMDIPWIVSVTSDEGLYPAAEFVFNEKLMSHLNENWAKIAQDLLFDEWIPQEQHVEINEEVRKEYLKTDQISINSRKQLIQMLSDRLFIAPAVNSAIAVAKLNKKPVHFYMYSHNNSLSLASYALSKDKTVIGVGHGDDYSLILKLQGVNTKATEEDKEMSETLLDMVATFAETGEVPKKLSWTAVPPKSAQFTYLDFRSPKDIKMKVNPTLGNRLKLGKIFKADRSAEFATEL